MAPFFSLVHEVQSPRRPDGASVPMDLVALALGNQSLDFGTLPRIACGNGLLGLDFGSHDACPRPMPEPLPLTRTILPLTPATMLSFH